MDLQVLPTFRGVEVPVRSGQWEACINIHRQEGRTPILPLDVLPGLQEDALFFLCGKKNLKQLLTIISMWADGRSDSIKLIRPCGFSENEGL